MARPVRLWDTLGYSKIQQDTSARPYPRRLHIIYLQIPLVRASCTHRAYACEHALSIEACGGVRVDAHTPFYP